MSEQQGKSVLVVEDSPGMRMFIRVALNRAFPDWSVLEAATGFEALKRLTESPIDLIITDINMPDLNGLEFIRYVKEHPHYRSIPVIIVSTENKPDDRKRGLALGASDYLTKPFEAHELIQCVTQTLNLKG